MEEPSLLLRVGLPALHLHSETSGSVNDQEGSSLALWYGSAPSPSVCRVWWMQTLYAGSCCAQTSLFLLPVQLYTQGVCSKPRPSRQGTRHALQQLRCG